MAWRGVLPVSGGGHGLGLGVPADRACRECCAPRGRKWSLMDRHLRRSPRRSDEAAAGGRNGGWRRVGVDRGPIREEVDRPVRQAGDIVRVVVGPAALGAMAAVVRSGTVGRFEATVFRGINRLPRELGGPVWLVMQGGSLAAAFVTSGGAYLAGQRGPARDLLVSGVSAW